MHFFHTQHIHTSMSHWCIRSDPAMFCIQLIFLNDFKTEYFLSRASVFGADEKIVTLLVHIQLKIIYKNFCDGQICHFYA